MILCSYLKEAETLLTSTKNGAGTSLKPEALDTRQKMIPSSKYISSQDDPFSSSTKDAPGNFSRAESGEEVIDRNPTVKPDRNPKLESKSKPLRRKSQQGDSTVPPPQLSGPKIEKKEVVLTENIDSTSNLPSVTRAKTITAPVKIQFIQTEQATWAPQSALRSHYDTIRSVKFHPAELAILTASEDHTVKYWRLTPSSPQ
jgi:hypothetical protein